MALGREGKRTMKGRQMATAVRGVDSRASLRRWTGLLALSFLASLAFAGMVMAQEAHIDPQATQEVTEAEADAIMVVVENHSWSDMRIYAVRSGTRYRLGTAYTLRPVELEVPQFLLAEIAGLELIAVPIGGGGTHYSGNVLINKGESLVWRLENRPSFSSVLLVT